MDIATVDHLLTTTRSVRKRLDLTRPVPLDVIERCIDIAMQAPSGSNVQGWHFVVVTDEEKRRLIGELYRRVFHNYRQRQESGRRNDTTDDPRAQRAGRILESAAYLAQHIHEVPVLIIPCIDGRVNTTSVQAQAAHYGSILPATWSLMLALRARGLGSVWTTFHLAYELEVGQMLAIPADVTQAALLPVAYFTGEDFHPAKRIPARERTYINGWGNTR